MTKAETARHLGYGDDIAAMDRDHDPLHLALCAWLGVRSHALADGRGEPHDATLANLEEVAVLAVQRFMVASGVGVP